MVRLIGGVVLGLALALAASRETLAQPPVPDPQVGDGRVSPFYAWTGAIPAAPGRMLRTETLDPTLGLPNVGMQARILYTSTNGMDGKTPVAVSGAYFEPSGTPPEGGWPLIAWAHGTVGMADICAPSWQGRSFRDVAYLSAWLAQGYAIVATDYQGLGTPGPHPYLATRPEAYSVLDSIRAALRQFPHIANKVVIVGQSQGGGAAFATAAFAPAYAPDVNIRGTVATGIPYLSPKAPSPSQADPDKVDPTIAYALYIGLMAQQNEADVKMADLFTDRALPVLALGRIACISQFEGDVASAGLTRANAFRHGFMPAFTALLPSFGYPTLKLVQPVFVGTGQNDQDVAPASQLALVKDACAAGSVVEAHLYAGLTHSGTVNASLKDSIPFVRKVMGGETITPSCSPQAQ